MAWMNGCRSTLSVSAPGITCWKALTARPSTGSAMIRSGTRRPGGYSPLDCSSAARTVRFIPARSTPMLTPSCGANARVRRRSQSVLSI
eukprot:scaffold308095_cov32-Tisochrysis_lutea.AAC.2